MVYLGSAVKWTRVDAWRKPLHGSAQEGAVSGADAGMMKIIGAALTGLCGSVATALLSLASADALNSTQAAGPSITCEEKGEQRASVSQPNTTVTVTCKATFTLQPAPAKRGNEDIYIDADCSKLGLLSSVCPGGTVTEVAETKDKDTTVNVLFSQLPASQQVVCLKCQKDGNGESDCLAKITVEPASPRGPQVCAGRGSSVTLRINEAGGSAQFACGKDLDLEPGDVTKAYADDCASQETLKDMSRSTVTGAYVTFKVDKLKKKRLCYLCKPKSADGVGGKEVVKDESCKIYVEVSGSTRSSSSVHFGFALPCLAAMLRFT